jgi:hypothetical protein
MISEAAMNFFSFQDRSFLSQDSDPLRCRGSLVSPHWRPAYSWMKDRYCEIVGCEQEFDLIWVWQPPSGVPPRDAEYRALSDVYTDFEDARQTLIIELSLPPELVLRSSYSRWNVLLDYCLLYKRAPECTEDWLGMFDCDTLDEHDMIQGVVPWIQRAWVSEVLEVEEALFHKRRLDTTTDPGTG